MFYKLFKLLFLYNFLLFIFVDFSFIYYIFAKIPMKEFLILHFEKKLLKIKIL